jgi:hypothetical protein
VTRVHGTPRYLRVGIQIQQYHHEPLPQARNVHAAAVCRTRRTEDSHPQTMMMLD